MDNTKGYLFNNQKKGQKFEERLQLLTRAWKLKWQDCYKHTQKLASAYASGYFNELEAREHPINLIDRGVSTIVPFLVEGNPKVLVESLAVNLRNTAYRTQLALNFLIEKMNLAEAVFIPAATLSMFGNVATRTFSEYDRVISVEGEKIKIGTPRVVVIEQVDYIGDPAAKTRDDFIIEGDIYRLPTEYAKDLFSKYADDIDVTGKLITKFSNEEIVAKGFDWNKLNLREYTVFQDIYIRDEGVIKTIMPYGNKPVCLRTVEYDGPGNGPYDVLGYKYFPGSPIAIPPAWAWSDLDYTMNKIAIAAREQAESQKNVIVAEPQSKKAAEKILKAANMDVIITKNAAGIKTISVGGVNPDNYNWMNFAEMEFTKTGANPDILGGRAAQAPTLGQEQMTYSNASRIVNNMNTRFSNFMTSVLNKLAYYVWTDPTVYIPVIDKIPGLGEVPIVFSQADKVGDFYDFVFNLEPYSTQRTSPELKYQRMMQFMLQWLLPTAQIAASQGAELDVPTATKIMADYIGLTNFSQIYKTAVPKAGDSVPFAMMPTNSKRRTWGTSGKGQGNDAGGALLGSREAQSQEEQSTMGLEPKTV